MKAYVNELDVSRYASLILNSGTISNVSVSIEGEENEVRELNESIESYLVGMKPWYGIISNLSFMNLFLLLFLLFMLTIMGLAWFGIIPMDETPSTDEISYNAKVIVALIFILPLLLGILFDVLKGWLSPLSYFAIGQGKIRYGRLSYIRNTIIGGFILSVAVALFLSLF